MGTTAINDLPYPEVGDVADVPADMRQLAEALDPLLGAGGGGPGTETPAAPLGPELGAGSPGVQVITCTIGQTYVVQASPATGVSVSGFASSFNTYADGWAGSFVATSATHTVTPNNSAAVVSVRELTGVSAAAFTAGGELQMRRKGNNIGIGNQCQERLVGGAGNTALGRVAHEFLTTGCYNVALGYFAQNKLTHGVQNVSAGYAAHLNLAGGYLNVAVGHFAASACTEGAYNTAVGGSALKQNTTGGGNTAVGVGACGGPSGDNNTYVGLAAGGSTARTGSGNTGVGHSAGQAQRDGDNNVFLGRNVGSGAGQAVTVAGSVAVGCDSTGVAAVTAADNDFVLGTGAHNYQCPGTWVTDFRLPTATGVRFGTSATQKIGFFGAVPTVRPSGDVLDALETLGLIASPVLDIQTVEHPVRAVTADYTAIAPGDYLILADATAAALTITLPATASGVSLIVKKIDSGVYGVTVAGAGGALIDGAAAFPLTAQFQSVTVISDGTDWYVA